MSFILPIKLHFETLFKKKISFLLSDSSKGLKAPVSFICSNNLAYIALAVLALSHFFTHKNFT